MKEFRKKRESLKFKIILALLGISLPAVVLLFLINTYAVERIQHQIYSSNLNLMNVHVSELRTELDSASGILLGESIQTSRINSFSSADPKLKYSATIEYHLENRDTLGEFEMLEGQIAYSPVNGNTVSHFAGHISDYKMRTEVLEYVKSHAGELVKMGGSWKTVRIGDDWILLCAAGNEKAVFCFWTVYELMLRPVENWKLQEKSWFCFAGRDGRLYTEPQNEELSGLSYGGDLDGYYFDGVQDKYLICGVDVPQGDFRLMNVVDKRESLGIFPLLRNAGICVLLFVFLIGVPWILRILNRNLFWPVRQMEQAIGEVERGNLETHIENMKSSREMEHLIQSFNEMIVSIRNLKIQNYEDSLEKQKMELDYLNLQMEPHFYLNTLNVISGIAQVGDTQLIPRMTRDLSEYMRYIMGSRRKAVALQDELSHVSHYLGIMEIRLGDQFRYQEEIDSSLMQFQIPPLMIQTLVENSLKYAFDVYKETIVKTEAGYMEGGIRICVSDNGPGYPEEYLARFQKNSPASGKHIGLINLRSRLNMMFGDRVEFQIRNLSPNGACAEIRIRTENTETGEKDETADR